MVICPVDEVLPLAFGPARTSEQPYLRVALLSSCRRKVLEKVPKKCLPHQDQTSFSRLVGHPIQRKKTKVFLYWCVERTHADR